MPDVPGKCLPVVRWREPPVFKLPVVINIMKNRIPVPYKLSSKLRHHRIKKGSWMADNHPFYFSLCRQRISLERPMTAKYCGNILKSLLPVVRWREPPGGAAACGHGVAAAAWQVQARVSNLPTEFLYINWSFGPFGPGSCFQPANRALYKLEFWTLWSRLVFPTTCQQGSI